ncbi:hypothetical protein QUA43_15340 [Microcoleus sp. N9_B4]
MRVPSMPMPYPLFAPHVNEKGYMYVFAIIVRSPGVETRSYPNDENFPVPKQE